MATDCSVMEFSLKSSDTLSLSILLKNRLHTSYQQDGELSDNNYQIRTIIVFYEYLC